MINIFNSFKEVFSAAIQKIAAENNLQIEEKDLKNFTVEPAKEKSHGDLACNVAMILTKKFAAVEALNNPRKLAQKIIETIQDENIVKLEIAGPGFINIFLKPQIFYKLLRQIVEEK